MKKFLIVVLVFTAALALVAAMGCSKSPTAPTDAEKTQTAVATLTAAEKFNFNSDTTSAWTAYGVLSAKTWNSTAGADHYGNAGCIQVTGDYSSAGNGSLQTTFAATNFTGKTISMWMKIPASMVDGAHPYYVRIYVQDASYGLDSSVTYITASGWQQFSWVLPGTLTQDITQIIQLGFLINGDTGSANAGAAETLLIDDVNW